MLWYQLKAYCHPPPTAGSNESSPGPGNTNAPLNNGDEERQPAGSMQPSRASETVDDITPTQENKESYLSRNLVESDPSTPAASSPATQTHNRPQSLSSTQRLPHPDAPVPPETPPSEGISDIDIELLELKSGSVREEEN